MLKIIVTSLEEFIHPLLVVKINIIELLVFKLLFYEIFIITQILMI